ncbi:Os01g0921450 [Oryza sativa Japonica Group]|uniref:Os01g0921450 protein n=1 Tax=Oryza sativa subsp. japonica TaxID=39947 RepID=A0A0P0VC31_ORYSJ|nr:hypothetical protein EE612_007622 [Oryza sativa]BAS75941.1 Os01g0921450 [Oryza sativa Japonica Group]
MSIPTASSLMKSLASPENKPSSSGNTSSSASYMPRMRNSFSDDLFPIAIASPKLSSCRTHPLAASVKQSSSASASAAKIWLQMRRSSATSPLTTTLSAWIHFFILPSRTPHSTRCTSSRLILSTPSTARHSMSVSRRISP